MNFCALRPPNTETLSDTVIGNVMPRVMIRHRSTIGDKRWRQDFTLDHQLSNSGSDEGAQKKPVQPVIVESLEHQVKASGTVKSLSSVINLIDLSTDGKCLASDLHTAQQMLVSIQAIPYPITDELKYSIVVDALKKKINHREYCRVSQARYRNKQHKLEMDIQNAVSKLQYEIQQLEASRNKPSHFQTTPTLWAIVAEYFCHFNYYVSSSARLQPTTSRYLYGIMAQDVIVGSHFGVEAQLENWKSFALYFDDMQLELRGMNMPTSDTLVAHTMVNVTITSNTLRRVFPHLNIDGCGGTKGGSWSPLATKMLDQKVAMHGSVVFGWDNATDKVVRVQFQADLMTPMIKLLGNLRNVSYVFEKAHVTPDCRLA